MQSNTIFVVELYLCIFSVGVFSLAWGIKESIFSHHDFSFLSEEFPIEEFPKIIKYGFICIISSILATLFSLIILLFYFGGLYIRILSIFILIFLMKKSNEDLAKNDN